MTQFDTGQIFFLVGALLCGCVLGMAFEVLAFGKAEPDNHANKNGHGMVNDAGLAKVGASGDHYAKNNHATDLHKPVGSNGDGRSVTLNGQAFFIEFGLCLSVLALCGDLQRSGLALTHVGNGEGLHKGFKLISGVGLDSDGRLVVFHDEASLKNLHATQTNGGAA